MPGITVAEGVVEVTADAKGVPREIAKDIEDGEVVTRQAGEKIGRQVFGGIVGAWAAIGATEKIGDFFVGSITGASDLNETLSKSQQIFGESARTIELVGDTAAEKFGLSKEAAIGAAASFGDMFTQLGFTQSAAAGMSQSVLQMATDLGSFNNLETGDVLDRISAAMRGEYDSLQAVIPNINAARVESEALAMTGKDQASALTAAEKASAVLAIVQKDGARAMGDFARTSDGAANQQKILTASMEDQQAKLGGLLLPAWTGFLGFLNNNVIPGISETIDWMGQNGDTMIGLASVVGIAAVAYWGITSAMAIHKAFTIASAAATGGLTFAQWALNAAMSANPIGLIVTALALLVGGIVWVATQTTFFQDVWTNVTTALGVAWNWLWTTVLEPVFNAIGAAFTWIYNYVILPIVTGIMIYIGLWAAVITWLWNTVISPVFAAIGAIFSWVWNTIISPVIGWISDKIGILGLGFQLLWAGYIQPALNAVGAGLNWVWNSIISPVFNAIGSAVDWVGRTIRGAFDGLSGFIGGAFQAVLGVVRGPLNGIIGLVNNAIRGLNSLKVTIPDWVPIVGGQTWGLNIPTIPMLAKGGVIRSGGTVLVGERGPELLDLPRGAQVTPLDHPDARPVAPDAPLIGRDLVINEAEDPLGSAGRVGAELRKWRKR